MSEQPSRSAPEPAWCIVADLGLDVDDTQFRCPYCGRTWRRGGRKEGFVKSGAQNHVRGCWEAALFHRGYGFVAKPWNHVVPLDQIPRGHCYRRIRDLAARKRREGIDLEEIAHRGGPR